MPPMAIDTVSNLVEALRQSRVLEPSQQEEVDRLQPRYADPRGLARELIQRGWLTPYQVNQLMQGYGNELVLGTYKILERIGAGGMGQVFKAKHSQLDKIVALKVSARNTWKATPCTASAETGVSKLKHPNIVMRSMPTRPATRTSCHGVCGRHGPIALGEGGGLLVPWRSST